MLSLGRRNNLAELLILFSFLKKLKTGKRASWSSQGRFNFSAQCGNNFLFSMPEKWKTIPVVMMARLKRFKRYSPFPGMRRCHLKNIFFPGKWSLIKLQKNYFRSQQSFISAAGIWTPNLDQKLQSYPSGFIGVTNARWPSPQPTACKSIRK